MSIKRIDIEKYCALCAREFTAEDESIICPDDGGFLMPLKHDPLIGQLVESKFEILEVIGCGGWGSIYKARDIKLGRPVAFKVLRADLASTAEKLQRFEREAKVMSAVSHPSICAVYDYGALENGQPYLVLEYLQGKTLEDIIVDEGRLRPERVANLMKQTAQAISAAHTLGIIHRDLKPANIMVLLNEKANETVKVIDFGLAKTYEVLAPEQLTRTGMTIGTPAYMSPEQVRGLPLDGRSDVYSLGCIMFRLLTGRVAVTGKNVFEIMQNHLNVELSRDDFDDLVPNAIKDVTLTCLEKDPAERYQNMRELEADLVLFESTGKVTRQRKMSANARQRLILGAICAALAVVAALAAFFTVKINAPNLVLPFMFSGGGAQSFSSQLDQINELAKEGKTDGVLLVAYQAEQSLRAQDKLNSPELVQLCDTVQKALQSTPRKVAVVPFIKLKLEAKKHALALDSEEYIQACKEAFTAARACDEDAARPYAEEYLKLTEKKYGPESREVCEPLANLAWNRFSSGNTADAVAQYERLLTLVDKHYKPRDQLYITTRGELSWILCNAGDYKRARVLSAEAINLMSDTTPPRFRLDLLGCGAQAARKCGDLDQSIKYLKEALSVSRKIDSAWGNTVILGDLGKSLFAAKRYSEAEPVLREAIQRMEKNEGTESSTYRLLLNDYVELLRQTARQKRADEVSAAGKI